MLLLIALFPLSARIAVAESGNDLILELRPAKERFYLHEQIAVTVSLLAGQVSVRNIRYPRLRSPAFDITEFSPPRQTAISRSGRDYAGHEFAAILTANKIGRIEIGPAELQCDRIDTSGGGVSYFGGSEPRSVTVRSEPIAVTVLPLPIHGRPAGFSGAVGRFTLSRSAAPTGIHNGDPVTVTTRIDGTGSPGGLSCPSIRLPGVRSYPLRSRRSGNSLDCVQVIVPEAAGEVEIPAAGISFFDPQDERYRTLESRPVRLAVSAVAVPPAVMPSAQARPAGRIASPPAVRDPLPYVAAGTLLTLLMLAWRRRKRPQPLTIPATDPSLAGWLAEAERALAADDPASFHTAVFRALQAHLGARYGVPAPGITGEIVSRVQDQAEVEADLTRLFGICDQARYAPDGTGDTDMADTLRLLRKVSGSG